MQILLVAATYKEISPLLSKLFQNFESSKILNQTIWQNLEIFVLVTGVGGAATTFQLTKLLASGFKPDLTLFCGIGGELSKESNLGDVYLVIEEQFSDLGAFNENGQFLDLWDLQLLEEDTKPFIEKSLKNHAKVESNFLPQVLGITSNLVTSNTETLQRVKKTFPKARIESMEGAYQFYVASQYDINFLSIRSTSNYVGERNKDNWKLGLAINNLNIAIEEILSTISNLMNGKK